jgi:Ca-activated chloride channel family protein
MTRTSLRLIFATAIAAAMALVASDSTVDAQRDAQEPQRSGQDGFRFKSGVELINVNVTVTDRTGRFVSGLRQEDFEVYEDGKPIEVTHFSSDRVPVSLGVVLDTSGSMAGDKWSSALDAIDRFLGALNGEQDEFFVERFSADPELVQEWTGDRNRINRALGRVRPNGGTAMYDAVAEAVPMAQSGQNRKKALVLISDGNDTNSRTHVSQLRQMIRETEVIVYAVGIDGQAESSGYGRPQPSQPRTPAPTPFPVPGRRGGGGFPFPIPLPGGGSSGGQRPGGAMMRGDDRVNVVALREITDDSGGRTEIVRDARDLDPATASIADELSKQYYLGYPSPGFRDGRWHTIRVDIRQPGLTVRARKGYIATS